MTAWKLVPVGAGPHLFVRAYAGVDANHLVNVGTLELRREDYADLAARLGARQAFTPASSRPLAVNSWMTGAELLAAIQAVSDFAERLADGEWETLTGPVTGAQLGELLTALEKVGERLVTCWCWSSPETFEGPQPDCPVHGAVRAYNQAAAEIERLRAELAAVKGAEPDLHDLHPQPGEAPAAPLPNGVEGWVPGTPEAGERADDA